MKVLLWNIEWATRASRRGERIQSLISEAAADVVCLVETTLRMIPEGGHSISSESDYGYAHNGGRRKVVLWSSNTWTSTDAIGSTGLPGGRFCSGFTLGVRFVGVCIPWSDAHVRTGRQDRKPWEDHGIYIDHLKEILCRHLSGSEPVSMLGDFNQRVPRHRQPLSAYNALMKLFEAGLTCVTKDRGDQSRSLIDHVAVGPRLTACMESIIPRVASDGLKLSDHDGIICRVNKSEESLCPSTEKLCRMI
jgi:endonuclease/exonuclease/phosphatase family metal-dependent hydrolase